MNENLIPQSERTKEEQRKIARSGGIASGKARREKKMMKETLEILLSMQMKSGQATDIEAIKSFATLKGKNITVQDAVSIAMLQKAMKGNVRAAEWVRDTAGQKPVENVVMAGEVNNPFAGLSSEDLKALIDGE